MSKIILLVSRRESCANLHPLNRVHTYVNEIHLQSLKHFFLHYNLFKAALVFFYPFTIATYTCFRKI